MKFTILILAHLFAVIILILRYQRYSQVKKETGALHVYDKTMILANVGCFIGMILMIVFSISLFFYQYIFLGESYHSFMIPLAILAIMSFAFLRDYRMIFSRNTVEIYDSHIKINSIKVQWSEIEEIKFFDFRMVIQLRIKSNKNGVPDEVFLNASHRWGAKDRILRAWKQHQ